MSHHRDDTMRHEDDAGLPRATLDAVRRDLAETRLDEPSAQAFARQADDIMAHIASQQQAAAAQREPAAERPERARWLDGVRAWWQSLGRVEVLAYAAMVAVLIGGLWAASTLLEQTELPEVAPSPTTDEVATAPETAPANDDTAVADGTDLDDLDEDAIAAIELDAMPDESLEALAELSVDEWSPDETDWGALADEDDETLTVATALEADLDAGELARLDRALSSDRTLFPR